MELKIEFDTAALKKRLEAKIDKVQAVLDAQVLKDSNYYIPKRDGDLERSSLSSPIGKGVLIWDAEYAKRLYHGEGFNFSKDPNPNARAKWFEAAKAVRLKEWEAVANREYRK
jgi:hypothetical protein